MTEADCSSRAQGTVQTVRMDEALAAGTYYVMLATDRGYRGVTLTARAAAAAAEPCEGEITILTPTGDGPLTAGRVHPVTWQAPADVRIVRIDVSWNAGATWQHLASLPAGTPRFLWYVPADQAATGAVLLRVRQQGDPTHAATRTLTLARP